MKNNCLKIAFYGKGGIGKSTIAANISAAMAVQGKRVLHIGCDPKADSTRCLVGKKIPTVLEQLRTNGVIGRDEVLYNGFMDISCVEAGGPEPGIGCAGRGIVTMMEELESLAVFDEDWDVIVFDVLGDVVCGGFAVPIRENYAKVVYIITSSEFMSLYAANNILKSVKNFSNQGDLAFGGLIYNQRNGASEGDSIKEFSEMINSNIEGVIPYSLQITLAELQGKTVVEAFPHSEATKVFYELAENILKPQVCKSKINTITNEELEEFCRKRVEIQLEKGKEIFDE